MKRAIDEQLTNWKEPSRRKPLIVRGARQGGKTLSIEWSGEAEFGDVAKIDFEKRPDIRPIFDGDLSATRLIEQLEVAVGRRIRPGHRPEQRLRFLPFYYAGTLGPKPAVVRSQG